MVTVKIPVPIKRSLVLKAGLDYLNDTEAMMNYQNKQTKSITEISLDTMNSLSIQTNHYFLAANTNFFNGFTAYIHA
jgi:hypothetical protein